MIFWTSLLAFILALPIQAQDLANPFSINDEPENSRVEPEKTPAPQESVNPPAPAPLEKDSADELKTAPTIPNLSGPVVDQADLLNPTEKAKLEAKIREIFQQGGPQLQILILKSLEGFPIEEYSIRVAEAWKIGKKKKGDGVIILMSQEDRQVRIEVGEGVEGDLTDVESHQIIQYGMIPEFRAGNFAKGFEMAVDAIAGEFGISAYEQSGLTPPKDLAKIRRSKRQLGSLLLPILIFFITFPLIAKVLGKNPLIKSFAGATYMGALTYFLIGHLFFIVLAVLFGFFIGLIGPLNFLMVMLSNGGRGRYYGGGGFGGGGGWSGGGGGFSGGGASGSW